MLVINTVLSSTFGDQHAIPPMKCEVKLFVAGKVFTEEVYAKDYQDAREVALARNPNAKVIGVTAKFN